MCLNVSQHGTLIINMYSYLRPIFCLLVVWTGLLCGEIIGGLVFVQYGCKSPLPLPLRVYGVKPLTSRHHHVPRGQGSQGGS